MYQHENLYRLNGLDVSTRKHLESLWARCMNTKHLQALWTGCTNTKTFTDSMDWMYEHKNIYRLDWMHERKNIYRLDWMQEHKNI